MDNMILDNSIDNNNDNDIVRESKDSLIEKLCIKLIEDMNSSINDDDYTRVFQFYAMIEQAQRKENSLDAEERLIFEKLLPMIGKN